MDAGTGVRTDNILLPGKQLPEGVNEGDWVEVFIYRDSEDRLIATTTRPLAQVGELAYLRVTAKTELGAFLDLGLERGLFLPFREQKFSVQEGKSYLVALYLDKSNRLCATTDIYDHLTTAAPYQKNEKVVGTVYLVKSDIGAFVAVDNRYKGLIPKNEYFFTLREGDRVEARVIRVREDGKLDLSPRDLSYLQMDKDAAKVLQSIRNKGGLLPLNDQSDPVAVKNALGMSKASFKRAIGRLLKDRQIVQTAAGLRERQNDKERE